MTFDNIETGDFNKNLSLNNIVNNEIGWVTKNTAILVFHGIGFQLPLETLDIFGRGLVKQYKAVLGENLELKHEVVSKKGSSDSLWFDNVLRISNTASKFHIDIYEYYWANYTEDKTNWSDLNKWVQGVVKGAKQFYKANSELGNLYKDKSIFFRKGSGNFIAWRYRLFLTIISQVFFIFDQFVQLLIWLFSHIPLVGEVAGNIIKHYNDTATKTISNLLGDITAYNVVDPKSKFYDVHRRISDGALNALRYLVEKANIKKSGSECDVTDVIRKHRKDVEFAAEDEKTAALVKLNDTLKKAERTYPSILVAAHSLGTQIAYDAINKFNFEINKGAIATYQTDGNCRLDKTKTIRDQMKGFITFGSPLDKIVFFLRENIPDEAYLRRQFLDDFHGFKQRPINSVLNNRPGNDYVRSSCGLTRFLEGTQWRNYYDDKDYISGGLDYYKGLVNINCGFKASKFGFTHSNYWACDKFYNDIICNFLN